MFASEPLEQDPRQRQRTASLAGDAPSAPETRARVPRCSHRWHTGVRSFVQGAGRRGGSSRDHDHVFSGIAAVVASVAADAVQPELRARARS